MATKTQPKTADSFKQYANSLFSASYIEYTNTETGEVIKEKLPCEYKNVYVYMFDQYLFFTKLKQPYFETGKVIALHCACSERTVRNAINLLVQAGVFEIKKLRGRSYMKNQYFIKDIALCENWKLLKSEELIQYEYEQLQRTQDRQQEKDNKKEEWETLHHEFCNSSKQANRSDSKQLPDINNTSVFPSGSESFTEPHKPLYKEPVGNINSDEDLYNDDPFHVGFYAAMNPIELIPTQYYDDSEQPPFEWQDCRYDPNCPF